MSMMLRNSFRAKKPIEPLIKQLEPLMVPSDIDELRKIVAEIEHRQAEGPGRFSSGDGKAPPSGPKTS